MQIPRAIPANLPKAVTGADFHPVSSRAKVELGRVLFFDKILSGNRNISCATCHHPLAGTGDDLSLSVGEGGSGLGRDRNLGAGPHSIHERVPRNAPAIFNLGAKEFKTLFHDGRLQQLSGNRYKTPVGSQMPKGLDNPLAVQAMLPVTSLDEMAGQVGENPIANAAANNRFSGSNGVWELLSKRIRKHRDYVQLFRAAYPGKIRDASEINFVHVANALSAYQATAFRTIESPFDKFLRGQTHAMDDMSIAGMNLFYGKAKCASCHSGKFQTDHQFHSIAMPQIGPGKGEGYRGLDDFGRATVSKKDSDRYKFRTPSLRNVAITGPWGHSGAYSSLEAIVRHHLNPVNSLNQYSTNQASMPWRSDLSETDFALHFNRTSRQAIANSSNIKPIHLDDFEIAELLAFLSALTDPRATQLHGEIPNSVPSGLPVSDYVSFPPPGSWHD